MDRFDEFLFKELSKNVPQDKKIAKIVVKRLLFIYKIKKIFSYFLLTFIFYPVLYILFFGIPTEFINFILNLKSSISILVVTGGIFYLLYLSFLLILLVLLLIFILKIVKQLKIKPRIN
ncbi:MAG: hypothetical protein DRI28_03995 [Caldiserica bacterium]|nr:MAG: hypothetical protein DRI28_03995 [Caldisericota bacterium]